MPHLPTTAVPKRPKRSAGGHRLLRDSSLINIAVSTVSIQARERCSSTSISTHSGFRILQRPGLLVALKNGIVERRSAFLLLGLIDNAGNSAT